LHLTTDKLMNRRQSRRCWGVATRSFWEGVVGPH